MIIGRKKEKLRERPKKKKKPGSEGNRKGKKIRMKGLSTSHHHTFVFGNCYGLNGCVPPKCTY